MIDYSSFNRACSALYLNIPYCKTPCSYCHYLDNIAFGYDHVPNQYVEMLCVQLDDVLRHIDCQGIESIYFGGGTPSLLSNAQIHQIQDIVEQYRSDVCEVSIEIHPGLCNFDVVDNSFFTRYSIGVQSSDRWQLGRYRRHSYSMVEVENLVSCVRGSMVTRKINFDFMLDFDHVENDILCVASLQPDMVTFYPNTKDRGVERHQRVQMALKIVAKHLKGYRQLYRSKIIYLKQGSKPSRYSKIEYEDYGNIWGIGHNAVSYIGNDSYLCKYENGGSWLEHRNHRVGERYLSALMNGIPVAATKKSIASYLPKAMEEHFFRRVSDDADVCDKHIITSDCDLLYLPDSEYMRFYEYLKRELPTIYSRQFLAGIGYGDGDYEVVTSVYNKQALYQKGQELSFRRKKRTPSLRILVEGIDGSGKDTFVQFFVKALKKRFYYGDSSRISVLGQPDSSAACGEVAKNFIENNDCEGNFQDVIRVLSNNRQDSEDRILKIPGIIILIRGILTDKATFEKVFGHSASLGEGILIPQWDQLIIVDVDPAEADRRIQKRNIPRTWREHPEMLSYFREFYLGYENTKLFKNKQIVDNHSLAMLKATAERMAEEIYNKSE